MTTLRMKKNVGKKRKEGEREGGKDKLEGRREGGKPLPMSGSAYASSYSDGGKNGVQEGE